MQLFLRYTYVILLSLLCISGARADSLRVSVLTCAPGVDAYAHFGHTAIRVTDIDNDKDIVFNYGCFDYTENMFVYKFIKGETDYLLGAESARYFFRTYEMLGIKVDEQVLNLSQGEANTLLMLLSENMKPENVQYRYNYLYDNCTTRARDMIERALTEEVIYKKAPVRLTARNELHEDLQKAPWLRFGIDLVLGQELDNKDFDKRQQMFIPAHYEAELDSAFVVGSNGSTFRLVLSKHTVLEANPQKAEVAPTLKPMMMAVVILILVVYISVTDFMKRKKASYALDAILSTMQGLAGIIVAFLFFFSEHPAVGSNWLVIILNPLYLLYAAYLVYCIIRKEQNRLAPVNMAVMAVFFVCMLSVSQIFDAETWVLALALLIRSICVFSIERRIAIKKKKKNQ